jgi:hypothetical protein
VKIIELEMDFKAEKAKVWVELSSREDADALIEWLKLYRYCVSRWAAIKSKVDK